MMDDTNSLKYGLGNLNKLREIDGFNLFGFAEAS